LRVVPAAADFGKHDNDCGMAITGLLSPRFGFRPVCTDEIVVLAEAPVTVKVTVAGPVYPARAVTGKLPAVAPAATLVVAGTDKSALLLVTFRVSPPVGAGAVRI